MSGHIRPENAPDKNHPLLMAARYNDAESEERQGNLHEWGERHGIDMDVVIYLAGQRALTAVLRMRGEKAPELGGPVSFTAEEHAVIEALTPIYVDAILIGWRAHELTE